MERMNAFLEAWDIFLRLPYSFWPTLHGFWSFLCGFWSFSHCRLLRTPKVYPRVVLISLAGPEHLPSSSFWPSLPCYIFPGTHFLAFCGGPHHPPWAFLICTTQLGILLWLCPSTVGYDFVFILWHPEAKLHIKWLFPPIKSNPMEVSHTDQTGWLASHQGRRIKHDGSICPFSWNFL